MTQQWIKVTDALPEYMQTCLIHTDIGFVTMAQYGGHKYCFCIGEVYHIATHWMPLPASPGSEPDTGPISSGTPCAFNEEEPNKVIPL